MKPGKPNSKTLTLLVLSVITFLGFIDTVLLLPIISLYAESLGATIGITGFIVGLYSIANTPANIVFGRLIDRVGKKIPLVTGLIGAAFSLVMYSLCRLPVQLGLVRLMHGIFGGMIGPATMSALSECAEDGRRGQVMGIYGISIAMATLIGYPVSGVIARYWGYDTLFFIAAGLLVIGSLAAMALPARNLGTCRPKLAEIRSLAYLASLVTRPGLRVAYVTIISLYFSFGGLITLLPFHVRQHGLDALHVGILLGIFSAFFIALQIPVGRISDRIGRIKPTLAGIVLCLISLLVLPLLDNILAMGVAMAFFGMAYGIIFPSVSSLVIDFSSPQERGIATGVYHALLTVGVAIGAPVIGAVGHWAGIQAGLFASAGMMMVALVVAVAALRNQPSRG